MIAVRMFAVVAVLATATAVDAGPPGDAKTKIAERLHKRAVKASRRGKWKRAVEHWEAAEAIRPHWKYALNIASHLAHHDRWMGAWKACQRARKIGIPSSELPGFDALEARAEAKLLEELAFIELKVEPPGARVIRNGSEWKVPHRAWMTIERSRLQVTAPEHVGVTLTWDHPYGARSRKTVRLNPVRKATPPPKPLAVNKSAGSALKTWGWVSAGVGIAAVATGAGLLAHLSSIASESRTLNLTATDTNAYTAEYDAIESRFQTVQSAGIAVTAIGGALLAGGVIMLVLDATSTPTPAAVVTPVLFPGGAGLQGQVRF